MEVLKMCSRKHRFKESCSSVFHGKHTINGTGNEKRQKKLQDTALTDIT